MVVLGALGALGGSTRLVFAACPGDPKFDRASAFRVTGSVAPTRYFLDHTTAQIGAMRGGRPHAPGMHNPGITLAEHGLKTDYQVGGIQRGGKKAAVCVWAETLTIDFAFNQMDVYVSNQYPAGTCPHQAILAHEEQHVAINKKVFGKYRALMERALRMDRTIPTKAKPLAVRSGEEGKRIISARVDRLINPLYARFKREVTAEHAKIDTMASYRKTQAKCKEW